MNFESIPLTLLFKQNRQKTGSGHRNALLSHEKYLLYLKYLLCIICLQSFTTISLAASKVALVIGNGSYTHAEHLPNTVNDAKAISRLLKRQGFNVVEGINLSKFAMKKFLRKFTKKLNNKTIALFYFAGHGIQKNGKNFLIPVNADIKKDYEIEYSSIELNMILSALNEAQPKLSIALIDACRDNPFEKRIRGVTRNTKYRGSGLAAIDNIHGTVLSYATEPGKTAVDGYGMHSPYTAALLKHLREPGISVQETLNQVGLTVMYLTNGNQKPWYASSPISKFCFAGCRSIPSTTTVKTRKNLMKASPNIKTVSAIKRAIERRDLKAIRKIVVVSKTQEQLLESIFSAYTKFNVAMLVPTRSISTNKQARVTVNITEAVNRKGNRVIPSMKWNYISFKLKKHK